ncbi:Ethanolamine-phosphate cytidylyltransferase [Ceratobasidium theobromae]|uniref:ethanolamine-phosphate cytidylyltransferase n=1 Tax=Ceratobasidium theobromae TaxID=1582974 RepID=A0A5N5R1P8_9AGAM|nr:Ethanolamine-phosphate cytidylyltransferase [Ceratobasidium theobromae]
MSECPKARLWLDGCFDGFHFAHANAVRQSRKFGDYVIVGVHSDRLIEKWVAALYDLIRGCRWVDEVAEDVPYITDMDFVAKYDIGSSLNLSTGEVCLYATKLHKDYVCHGDDPVLVGDIEMTATHMQKRQGSTKNIPERTCFSAYHLSGATETETRLVAPDGELWKLIDEFAASCPEQPPIIDFSDPNNRHDTLPQDNSRDVVYIGGSWDVFGSGHVELLRRAYQTRTNTYLIVGVWGEQAVWDDCGERPLLDTLERVLAVLQCQYTSAVIIDAPAEPTPAFFSEIAAKFVVNPGDQFAATDGIQMLSVVIPKLQTIEELRERIITRKEIYSVRQKKKRA